MPITAAWIIAFALAALLAAGLLWVLRGRAARSVALPTAWTLTARPVFNADERRVYRQLREALPHHVVLAKLPLVRFSQATDPQQVRYWYELLGTIHVSFAICSANGRVLAAIDLEGDRANPRRMLEIKQSVLGACRVRYLRCQVDQLPSVAELQLLVPQGAVASRAPQPANLDLRHDALSASRRRGHPALWHDSKFFQDSFFGTEQRADSGGHSEFGTLGGPGGSRAGGRGGMAPPVQGDDTTAPPRGDRPHAQR